MAAPRESCCVERACGTRWRELRAWACQVTGKGVVLLDLVGDEQGKAPFFAQPVGFDGRSFRIARDHGCDTEKLLHEVCHWLMAPRERRGKQNYGLGPGPRAEVGALTSDNEEVATMLLERKLAPHFALPDDRIARPDYNVADRRNVDWDACETRAEELYRSLLPGLSGDGRAAGFALR